MGLPTETRSYAGFRGLAQQAARSRILGGIHYQFDSVSQEACVKAPEFAAAHYMRPR